MFKALPAHGVVVSALLGALAGLSLPAMAQVNKCTQADGSISYQSTPCGDNAPAAAPVTAAQLNAAQHAREQAAARAKAASEAHAAGASPHPHAASAAKPAVAGRCRTAPPKSASGPARSPSATKPC